MHEVHGKRSINPLYSKRIPWCAPPTRPLHELASGLTITTSRVRGLLLQLIKIARNLRTGSFGLNKSTSVGNPTPQSFWVVRSWRQAGDTRRLRGRVTVQSACPSASYSPRSYVPQAPGRKARENAHHARRRLCTFSRSVSDSVFRSICIVCQFLLLHRVATCPVYQYASSWHILPTPTLLHFCLAQTNL